MEIARNGMELRRRLRNWSAFPLLLGIHASVEEFGLGTGIAVFLLVCVCLRPLVMAALRSLPVAPRGATWLGAFAAAALTLVAEGPAAAAMVYLALYALGLGLFSRRAAEA